MPTRRNIVSVSRRTDIPAFYTPWFLNRLRSGYVLVRNPFGGRIYAVSLLPEDVAGFVFWSRNYAPLLPHLESIRAQGYRFYFHFTLTGLPRVFEKNRMSVSRAVEQFSRLARKTSPRHVIWRYDPIVISDCTEPDYHLERFQDLCGRLQGTTERCVISFPTLYKKVIRRFERLEWETGIRVRDPHPEEKRSLVRAMAEIGRRFGIALYACCSEDLVDGEIRAARCVDAGLLSDLFAVGLESIRRNPSRPQCGCSDSRDIGAYDTCLGGCVYCYACGEFDTCRRRYSEHDPDADILVGGDRRGFSEERRRALRVLEESGRGKRRKPPPSLPVGNPRTPCAGGGHSGSAG